MTKMMDCCKKAYARGYQRGYRWPDHKPPIPPHPIIGRLIQALIDLRDCADGQMAAFDEDDPMARKFDPYIEAADEALSDVRTWLINVEDASEGKETP